MSANAEGASKQPSGSPPPTKGLTTAEINQRVRRSVKCYHCKQTGHLARNCPLRHRLQADPDRNDNLRYTSGYAFSPNHKRGNQNSIQCYSCQNYGHYAKDCKRDRLRVPHGLRRRQGHNHRTPPVVEGDNPVLPRPRERDLRTDNRRCEPLCTSDGGSAAADSGNVIATQSPAMDNDDAGRNDEQRSVWPKGDPHAAYERAFEYTWTRGRVTTTPSGSSIHPLVLTHVRGGTCDQPASPPSAPTGPIRERETPDITGDWLSCPLAYTDLGVRPVPTRTITHESVSLACRFANQLCLRVDYPPMTYIGRLHGARQQEIVDESYLLTFLADVPDSERINAILEPVREHTPVAGDPPEPEGFFPSKPDFPPYAKPSPCLDAQYEEQVLAYLRTETAGIQRTSDTLASLIRKGRSWLNRNGLSDEVRLERILSKVVVRVFPINETEYQVARSLHQRKYATGVSQANEFSQGRAFRRRWLRMGLSYLTAGLSEFWLPSDWAGVGHYDLPKK
nr:hypothetical protein 2 [Beihai tombus-like virus 7]